MFSLTFLPVMCSILKSSTATCGPFFIRSPSRSYPSGMYFWPNRRSLAVFSSSSSMMLTLPKQMTLWTWNHQSFSSFTDSSMTVKHVEFLDGRSSLTDALVREHIELQLFMPATFMRRVMSRVLMNVTIGPGVLMHILNAYARVVRWEKQIDRNKELQLQEGLEVWL